MAGLAERQRVLVGSDEVMVETIVPAALFSFMPALAAEVIKGVSFTSVMLITMPLSAAGVVTRSDARTLIVVVPLASAS